MAYGESILLQGQLRGSRSGLDGKQAEGSTSSTEKVRAENFLAISEFRRRRVDKIVSFIGQALRVPCVAIVLEDENRERWVAGLGLPHPEISEKFRFKNISRCERGVVMVEEMLGDIRFRDHPFVAGAPYARAGIFAPLIYQNDCFLGHVMAWDVQPRRFSPHEMRLMHSLAEIVVDELDVSRKMEGDNDRLQLLEGIFDNAAVGIAVNALDGRRIAVNRQFASMLGATKESLRNEPVSMRVHPDDRDEGVRLLKEVRDGKRRSYQREHRYIDPEGRVRWARATVSIMDSGQSGEAYAIAIIEDINERRNAETMRNLLLGEINHRVKNTLAIVQGIAKQLLRMTKNPEEFAEAFERRVEALANAHDMLTDESWSPLPLNKVIERVATGVWAPYAERLKFRGATVVLNAQTIVMLGLMLHELLTNAVKHGALKYDRGWVDIVASMEQRDDEQWLRLVWREHGGVVTQPKRKGLGSYLVERGARLGLSGEGKLEFDPSGLRCELTFPVFGTHDLARRDLRA